MELSQPKTGAPARSTDQYQEAPGYFRRLGPADWLYVSTQPQVIKVRFMVIIHRYAGSRQAVVSYPDAQIGL